MNTFRILLILSLSFLLGDAQKEKIGVSGNIGVLSPINTKTRSEYTTGHSAGLIINFPKKLTLFKHPFTISSEINMNVLNGINNKDMTMVSTLVYLKTWFDKSPFNIHLGMGIADYPYSGLVGLTTLDFLHKLEIKKIDISISLRLQQVINVTDNYNFDFNHSLYGININFGKSLN